MSATGHFPLARLIARNLVPLAGIVFLGWSAPNLLLAYFADTLAAVAAVFMLIGRQMIPLADDATLGERINWYGGMFAVALFITGFIGATLGFFTGILLKMLGMDLTQILVDRTLQVMVALQAATTFTEIVARTPRFADDRTAKREINLRFAFAFVRWIAIIVCTFPVTLLALFSQWLAGFLMVAVYSGMTVLLELDPRRVYRALNLQDPLLIGDPGVPGTPSASSRRKSGRGSPPPRSTTGTLGPEPRPGPKQRR